ncbi:Hypothetical predicted protein [Olea europaea subsp. europaea]|uniref:Small ribosomal subunit protein mS41 SAM domain-containing protein n=1 Tax=Olea europaea subsp. europaea TaxID=158383 RepID=A0A8S0RFI6_OLEEU|nr:Hypothetical predicted protein [Olea europaea subsp. europaea]
MGNDVTLSSFGCSQDLCSDSTPPHASTDGAVKVGIPEFLNEVGKGVEQHVEKLDSEFGDLQKLLVARTVKLKRVGLKCQEGFSMSSSMLEVDLSGLVINFILLQTYGTIISYTTHSKFSRASIVSVMSQNRSITLVEE